MAYYPYAVETGGIYTLTGNGARAVFNDPTDPDYVGNITELTGLDSAEVRESAEELVESDGGSHGNFYFGRRPITITFRTVGISTIREREIRIDKARRASMALRGDATLTWRPSLRAQIANPDYIEMFTKVRRQQPFRESGNWVKEVQIALVSEYAPIFSVAQRTASGAGGANVVCENRGSYPAYPLLRVAGITATNFTITNMTPEPDQVLRTVGGIQITSGQRLEIDTLNHQAYMLNADDTPGASMNRYIDWGATDWPSLFTGNNTLRLSGTGTLTALWRDTWA